MERSNTVSTQSNLNNGSVMKRFGGNNMPPVKPVLIGVGVVVVLFGIITGGLLSGKLGSKNNTAMDVAPGAELSSNEAGSAVANGDTATGTLTDGGIKGEGTHHLVRPGGDSQNVYLTSTVIDLGSFVGKKVQIWGQTVDGRHAGWLMDVSKIKVVE